MKTKIRKMIRSRIQSKRRIGCVIASQCEHSSMPVVVMLGFVGSITDNDINMFIGCCCVLPGIATFVITVFRIARRTDE
jgi:hypothetical protein